MLQVVLDSEVLCRLCNTFYKNKRGCHRRIDFKHTITCQPLALNKTFRFSGSQFPHCKKRKFVFSSVIQSCPTPWPHESQHPRPPCPSPILGVHSDSRPSSQWCHPAISSSVVAFSSCPQSLPASVFSNESTFRMRWPKYWSFSFSIIPSKEIPGLISFRMDWLDFLA